MKPGDAATEIIGDIEKRRIGIGHLQAAAQHLLRDIAACLREAMTILEQLNSLPDPNRPMTEQTADDTAFDSAAANVEAIWGQQVREHGLK
jgi:hypothetical protein